MRAIRAAATHAAQCGRRLAAACCAASCLGRIHQITRSLRTRTRLLTHTVTQKVRRMSGCASNEMVNKSLSLINNY